jgi:TDG/mug DNA glycosylase family protein
VAPWVIRVDESPESSLEVRVITGSSALCCSAMGRFQRTDRWPSRSQAARIARPIKVTLGERPWTIGPSHVFVVPNSSGAHATMQYYQELRWWTRFRLVTL